MIASMCEYQFRNGEKCKEEKHETSPKYCILHIDFPDTSDPEYNNVKSAKDAKVEEKIDPKNRDFNFEGAKIWVIDLSKRQDVSGLIFDNATIEGYAWFTSATIKGSASFDSATIKGSASFDSATIKGYASFDSATIKGDASFRSATIKGDASFRSATIKGDAWFTKATIEGYVWFTNATIEGDTWFMNATIKKNAWFTNATIKGYAFFDRATIEGDTWFDSATIMSGFSCETAEAKRVFTFKNAKFSSMEAQEEVCRKAIQILEHIGERDEADYHFYRMMEAKRKRKRWFVRIFELPLQYVIWYWVYPIRVFLSFIGFFLVFGFLFWFVGGEPNFDALKSSMRSSFFALFNPVAAIEKAPSGLLGALIVIAGFIGLFTWPVFVASLAKKYGR